MSDEFDFVFGCKLVYLPRFEDERGYLSVLTPEGIGNIPYVYHSVTFIHQSRDTDKWHMHKKHTDRFVVLRGKAMFYLSDGTTSKWIAMSEPCRMLIVPPGVWHRFQNIGEESLEVVNLPDAVYDPDDEFRIPIGVGDA